MYFFSNQPFRIGKNDYLLKNILQTYLNKIFKNPANTQFPVYERVTFLLSKSLKLKTGDLDVIRFAWFFLLIIAKSMILESYASSILPYNAFFLIQ